LFTVCQTVSCLHTQQTPWSVFQDGWKRTHIHQISWQSSKHAALRITHSTRNNLQHRSEDHHCRHHGTSNVIHAKPSIDLQLRSLLEANRSRGSLPCSPRTRCRALCRSSLARKPKALTKARTSTRASDR